MSFIWVDIIRYIRKNKKKDSDRYVMHSQNQLGDRQTNDLKFIKRFSSQRIYLIMYICIQLRITYTSFVYSKCFFHLYVRKYQRQKGRLKKDILCIDKINTETDKLFHIKGDKKTKRLTFWVAEGVKIIAQQRYTPRWKALNASFQVIIEPFLCD